MKSGWKGKWYLGRVPRIRKRLQTVSSYTMPLMEMAAILCP